MMYLQKHLDFNTGGVQKCSLLDFPEKISAIVFTQGCNFRCRYCHNPDLINISQREKMYQKTQEFFSFLKIRTKKLDGVVITGGEPTLQKDLRGFLKEIKTLGFKTKLDTNGSAPDVLETLLKEGLIDYIAMDIKAPFKKYSTVTGVKTNTKNIQKSVELVLNSNINYEFRTTLHSKLVQIEDFKQIGKEIKGAKKYILQKFENQSTLDKTLGESMYTESDFVKIKTVLEPFFKEVHIR